MIGENKIVLILVLVKTDRFVIKKQPCKEADKRSQRGEKNSVAGLAAIVCSGRVLPPECVCCLLSINTFAIEMNSALLSPANFEKILVTNIA